MSGIPRSMGGTVSFIHDGILRRRDAIFPYQPGDEKWNRHGRCEVDRSVRLLSRISGFDERYGNFPVTYGGGRTDQSADSEEISAVRASICAFCGSRNHDNDIIRMLKERRV